MKPTDLFDKIAEDYSLLILNWAIKKTGSRAEGEDLSQEVLYQILSFVKGKTEIEKLDNLIWKIAHYTWCNRLRRLKKEGNPIGLDTPAGLYIVEERDYIGEISENEAKKEELAMLRKKISALSKLQREIIIGYYLENLSVSDLAKNFGINKSAVKWHLFDARKKIKKEMEKCNMDDNLNYVYKPGKLFLGSHGETGPDQDTKRVNDSLIRQNICLLCYGDNGKTIEELAEMTGIPSPYLEFDVDWLLDREFLILENKRYITNFGVKDRRHFQGVRDIYLEAKETYYRPIMDYFNSHEQDIRNIGFYGCEFEWGKLLWSILTLYLRYFSESEPLKTLKKANSSDFEFELHKDGGRYSITAFDQSEGKAVDFSKQVISEPLSEPENWHRVNGIWCGNVSSNTSEFRQGDSRENAKLEYATYWLGIYTFSGIPSALTRDVHDQKIWKTILAELLSNDFSIANIPDQNKEKLAIAVKENIIEKQGDKYIPKFPIFTVEQFETLYMDIFAPLVRLIEPQTKKLLEKFEEINGRNLPKKIKSYINRWTYFDIWDSGIKNFMFAAEDGYLYMPKTPEDGTSLTLSFVY
ncbi:MAG: RNA polymerase sigma factor [Oscillospiraceae bacterium]|nr:RNA polymerase sigma factor [Oscillospiraceae bacterium]